MYIKREIERGRARDKGRPQIMPQSQSWSQSPKPLLWFAERIQKDFSYKNAKNWNCSSLSYTSIYTDRKRKEKRKNTHNNTELQTCIDTCKGERKKLLFSHSFNQALLFLLLIQHICKFPIINSIILNYYSFCFFFSFFFSFISCFI